MSPPAAQDLGTATIKWDTSGMSGPKFYKDRLIPAVVAGLGYVATSMERYAKLHAPWTDRTGAARRGLHGYATGLGDRRFEAVIAHGRLVPYGIYLEYRPHTAIIEQTINVHRPEVWPIIKRMLDRLTGGPAPA